MSRPATNEALFRRTRAAITAISDVRFPFPGSVVSIEGRGDDIELHLSGDHGDQAAEALLAWFYRLKNVRLSHHRGESRAGGPVFVTVTGSYFAVPTRFRVTAAFHNSVHAGLLCPEDHDHAAFRTASLSVHRLRHLQMLQRSGDAA